MDIEPSGGQLEGVPIVSNFRCRFVWNMGSGNGNKIFFLSFLNMIPFYDFYRFF
jgi:hypothetical protein